MRENTGNDLASEEKHPGPQIQDELENRELHDFSRELQHYFKQKGWNKDYARIMIHRQIEDARGEGSPQCTTVVRRICQVLAPYLLDENLSEMEQELKGIADIHETE